MSRSRSCRAHSRATLGVSPVLNVRPACSRRSITPTSAPFHAIEKGEGELRYLVLELVDGKTLEEILAERPPPGTLPIDDALNIVRQISVALEEAHEKGIIHRDLKPANIKVTPEGVVE